MHRASVAPNSSGSADSRVVAARDRLYIIRQTVMRNEHFSPSTLPSKDREHLLTVFQSEYHLDFGADMTLAANYQAIIG
jgi:DNA polymerase epsilon subunit 2